MATGPASPPVAPVTAVFGTLLRDYREAAGLSQEDLAERAGLTASAIGALERGERRRPYPHTVRALAAALALDDARRTALIAALPRRIDDAGGATGIPTVAAPAAPAAAPAVAPVVPPSIPGTAAGFVGRRAELQALEAALAAAAGGRGSIAMLTGEAGIGKTRLAREFAAAAAAQGAAVLWGSCFEGDWRPAYGPWVEAITEYAHRHAAAELARRFGAGGPAIAQLVPEVRAALPDLPELSPLSPEEARYRLHDAIIRFLLAIASDHPLVLVLDDLHWADLDTLRLLSHLARFVGQARLLVVGAYRDPEFGLHDAHPLMDTLAALVREEDYARVLIRGLSREEVAEYLARAAGEPLPQALVNAIEEETAGNPFYAGEVFRHLTEEAKVQWRGGRWSTDRSIKELGIPEGVRQVVGRRVARLSADTRALLRVASGFTAGFTFEVLQALSDLSEDALLDCLDEALQAGLLHQVGPASAAIPASSPARARGPAEARYAFAHAIARHALYDGLTPDRRTRLHRRLALALEQVHRGEEAEDAAELAAQYHASAPLPGAEQGIPHALRAAAQARTAYAHGREAAYLRLALDLAAYTLPEERAELLRRLAIAEAEAVELDRAPQTVAAAQVAMGTAGVAPRVQAEFLAVVARALKEGGATTSIWEPLVERGLELAGETKDLSWARLALLRDHFESIQSGPIGGVQWLGSDPEAVAVARAQGDEEDYARTLEPLDCRTRAETEAILALARSWSRPSAIMRALEVVGRDLLYRHGDFHGARKVYEELLSVGERAGSIPSQAEALAQLATTQLAIGDLPVAQQLLRRAQEVIAHLGAGHRLRFTSTGRAIGLAYFVDGDWSRLAAEAAQYATGAVAARSPVGLVAAAMAALSASRAGDAPGARDLLRHVTVVTERVTPAAYLLSLAVGVAAIAVWELAATEYAATYRRLALELLRAGAGDPVLGPLELWVARMAILLGDAAEAQHYLEQARSKVSARGLTHIRAIVDYDQACALIRAGAADRSRIMALLDAALEGFRAHGMLCWASRAAEQQAALTVATGSQAGGPAARAVGSGGAESAGLTAREVEVLRLVVAGMTNKGIAAELVVSVPTVERHVANIYGKIGARRRYDAIAFVRKHNLGAGSG